VSRTIFIIDDNHEIIELTRFSLEHLDDCSLQTFATPQAALNRMRTSGMPDLIITDLKMSSMNGIELLVHLRKLSTTVPVIIFTGHPEVLPPGCNCYSVFKDNHGFDRLVEMVEKILGVEQSAPQQA